MPKKKARTKRLLAALCLCLLLSACGGETAEPETETASGGDTVISIESPAPVIEPAPDPLGHGEIAYEDGAAPLTAEQEELLLTYLTRTYEALAQLEEADFSDLFTDPVQAQASAATVAFQVGMRTLIDGVDYSLTSYRYTLVCEETSVQEDGSVVISAAIESTEHFAQLPDVDARRNQLFHRLVLEETEDGWKIRQHWQFDALYSQLMRAAGSWEGDFATSYIAAVPEYLEALAAYQAEREAQRGETASLPAASNPYDREAALAYGDQYALDRNADWPDYTGQGGNCQNYVSQCLLAGGIPVDGNGDAVWTYDDGVHDRSGSWASVTQFRSYAANNTGFGLAALTDAPYFTGEPGDLIQMGTEDSWHHVVLIRDLVTDEVGNTVDYLVNSNTNDMHNYPASLYGYPVFSLTRIMGWNSGA